jgi:ABC-type multidrug transport system fused ATPase/permease subunit
MRLMFRYPRLLAIIGVRAFLGPLVTAPGPYLGKIIIDDIIFRQLQAPGRQEVTAWLGVPSSIWMLGGIVLLGVMLKLLGSLIGGWQSHYILQITRNSLHELRLDTAERVIGAQQKFFESTGAGRIASRLTHDSGAMDGSIFSLLRQFMNAAFTVVIVMGFMLAMNPWLTLIVLATMPITALLTILSYRKLRHFSREESDRWAGMTATATEIFSSVKIIRAFCAEPAFLKRLQERSEAVRYEGIHHWTTMHTVNSLLGLLSSLGADIFLFVGGVLAIQGKISFGEFFAFAGYQGMLWGPINVILNTGQTTQMGTASADKINELLHVDREPYLERAAQPPPAAFKGEVKMEEMHFSYDGNEDVLRNIDLHFKPGTMTALVGQSGSGKTTIANLLLGMYLPTKGRLHIDGVDVRQWDLRRLRSSIGVVLQESVLFDDTVRGNLCLGRDFTDDQLWSALRSSHLDDAIKALPQGLDTQVGQGGMRLSGGQKQRVAIARVFLRDPRLLILDEATSALDSETEQAIQRSFDALMTGRTSVVIAHRLSTIFRADQIVVLRQGRVVEVGTHDELSSKEGGHYQQLFQAQIEGLLPMSGPTRRSWAKS